MRGELAAANERLVQLTFFRLFPLALPLLFLDLLIQECLVYLQMSGKQSRESLSIEAANFPDGRSVRHAPLSYACGISILYHDQVYKIKSARSETNCDQVGG